jgi:hypothetical protein
MIAATPDTRTMKRQPAIIRIGGFVLLAHFNRDCDRWEG